MPILYIVFSLKQLELCPQWLFLSRLLHLWRNGLKIQLHLLSLTWLCDVHILEINLMPPVRKRSPVVAGQLICLSIGSLDKWFGAVYVLSLPFVDPILHKQIYTLVFATLTPILKKCLRNSYLLTLHSLS